MVEHQEYELCPGFSYGLLGGYDRKLNLCGCSVYVS